MRLAGCPMTPATSSSRALNWCRHRVTAHRQRTEKFWLTVQSLCPDTENARRWLSANGQGPIEELTIE